VSSTCRPKCMDLPNGLETDKCKEEPAQPGLPGRGQTTFYRRPDDRHCARQVQHHHCHQSRAVMQGKVGKDRLERKTNARADQRRGARWTLGSSQRRAILMFRKMTTMIILDPSPGCPVSSRSKVAGPIKGLLDVQRPNGEGTGPRNG